MSYGMEGPQLDQLIALGYAMLTEPDGRVLDDEALVGLCTECRKRPAELAVHDGTVFDLPYGTCRRCADSSA